MFSIISDRLKTHRTDGVWVLSSLLLLVDGHTGVAALHDVGHGGEVQGGGAGQHEALLQRGEDVLHCLAAQGPAAKLLLHKLTGERKQAHPPGKERHADNDLMDASGGIKDSGRGNYQDGTGSQITAI